MSVITSIRYTLQLMNSNFGRGYGWFLEWNSRSIAELDDCRHDDMFWYSYRITCRSKDDQAIACDPDHWQKSDFLFVNRVTGERVDQVIAGNAPYFISNERILLRGLSLIPRNRLERWIVTILSYCYRSNLR